MLKTCVIAILLSCLLASQQVEGSQPQETSISDQAQQVITFAKQRAFQSVDHINTQYYKDSVANVYIDAASKKIDEAASEYMVVGYIVWFFSWIFAMWGYTFALSCTFCFVFTVTPIQPILAYLMGWILPVSVLPHPWKKEKGIAGGHIYDLSTYPDNSTQWFSLTDCLSRYSYVLMAITWVVLTRPISYPYFVFKYNWLWYGKINGTILSLFWPCIPVSYFGLEVARKIQGLFVKDWMMEGPGRVFFMKPSNPIASFIWDLYLTQSMFIGQFFLVGTHHDAIEHTWYDAILTKHFWRDTLTKVGARLPRALGNWDGKELTINYPGEIERCDLVVKIPDSFLGIGDSFWNKGRDFKTLEDVKTLLAKPVSEGGYDGKEALVLELVRPKKSLGVHSMDVVTIRTPDDDVKVLSVLLWTDCTTDSSHSCQAGYVLDVETETVVDSAKWYSSYFATMKKPLVGTKYPGVKKACEFAVEAHKNIEHKWLTAVGWDMMVMEDELVFFEGNFAGARTPRRIFLSFANFLEFMTNYFWPFGSGHNVTPSQWF